MRVPRPLRSGPAPVFARARPETVSLREEFAFQQVISMQPSQQRDGAPTGRIKIAVPLDGDRYFSREAIADVQRAGWQPGTPASATVGHLLLSGFERTDLGDSAGLNDGFGSIPLRVPLPQGPGAGLEQLSEDRTTCVIEHEYRPEADEVALNVFVDLLDPDGVDLLGEERTGAEMRKLFHGRPSPDQVAGKVKDLLELAVKNADRQAQLVVDDVAQQITQQVSFRSYLQLRIFVQLILPASVGEPGPRPRISRVSLDWPTLTSMRSLHLEKESDDDSAIRYNPNTRAIEWTGTDLHALKGDGSKDAPRTYLSDTMVLRIDQPGELYQAPTLTGTVEVEVPGVLLSGMKARLFFGTGALNRDATAITALSTVSSKFTLVLDDAFARRVLTPFQHLFFDEVIPDPMRVADVRTTLESRGFEVLNQQLLDSARPGSPALRHFLIATRSEGPDVMELWIYLEGRHQDTERQRQRGGDRFTTKVNSGELKMFIRGSLPGDSRELIKEMNNLQGVLRDRFARLRQMR